MKYILQTQNLSIFNGKSILQDISLGFPKHTITAIIGPSGAGKTTFLLALNQMNPPSYLIQGKVIFQGVDLYQPSIDRYQLRMLMGMLFSTPEIFPMSLYNNLTLVPSYNRKVSYSQLMTEIEKVLRQVHLWSRLKNKLFKKRVNLSTSEQQLFCLARILLLQPQVLLLDEPTANFDSQETFEFEQVLLELKDQLTIILVTHNLRQAARISDYTALFQAGKLIETGKTSNLFTAPQKRQTDNYLSQRFGF